MNGKPRDQESAPQTEHNPCTEAKKYDMTNSKKLIRTICEKLKAGGASDREKAQRRYLIVHRHHEGTRRQLWQAQGFLRNVLSVQGRTTHGNAFCM